MYIHIYIRTQVRFVIASSRRRQLGGQLCAPLQGSEEYLIPSLVFLISPPVPLSPLSHLIRRLRRLLKWLLRRLLLSHLLSHPYLEGGRGPRGCSFVSKSQDAAPFQSGRPIQTVRLITASLSIVFIYTPSFRFFRSREEGAAVGRGIRGENGIRASIPRGTRAGVPRPFCRALLMSRPIDRDALIDNRMSVNRSSGSRVDVSRLERRGLFPNGKSIG